VALSPPDVRSSDVLYKFIAGYREMLRQLQPVAVWSYGILPVQVRSLDINGRKPIITAFPKRWH